MKGGDVPSLSSLLRAGLSPDPRNAHGDSVLGMVCRRGDVRVFQALLKAGASVGIADAFGRTPLHHAAWAGETTSFEIVGMVLGLDPGLLYVTDRHGKTPLQYVPRSEWERWATFLESRKDEYWPKGGRRGRGKDGAEGCRGSDVARGGCGQDIKRQDLLSVDLVEQLASGMVRPEDVERMSPEEKKSFSTTTTTMLSLQRSSPQQQISDGRGHTRVVQT